MGRAVIRAVTYYQAVCDFCGKVDDEGEYSAWSDHGDAHDNAIRSDWIEWRDLLTCWDCQEGELHCESCGEDDLGWAGNCVGCWERVG